MVEEENLSLSWCMSCVAAPAQQEARVDPLAEEGEPCTMHPTHHNIHSTPYTLHPTPYTLTLHPTPYTLHLTPYTCRRVGACAASRPRAASSSSALLLSSLELSDTQVYEPEIRALLGTASHFCEGGQPVVELVHELRGGLALHPPQVVPCPPTTLRSINPTHFTGV